MPKIVSGWAKENGLSMYDPYTERFTNYFYPNYPLISNYITCLGFDPVAGDLIILTRMASIP